jgi:putative Mg2+ transporter-C (MgtC) family protein
MFTLPGQQELLSVGLLDASFRLLVAVVLGGILGWERERIGKPAGLRTHMMVTLGAALFVLLGVELLMEYSERVEDARLDPTRVLQGVVGGIGFWAQGASFTAVAKWKGSPPRRRFG